MARLLRSASRLLLPTFDAGELLACLRALVRTDAAWVPSTPGCALYMRPTSALHSAPGEALGCGWAPPLAFVWLVLGRILIASCPRPPRAVFATGPSLGVAPASEATLVVLLSPTGPYLPPSAPPPSLYLDERLLRAGHGGVGQYKVGGNYAPTLGPAAAAASAHGCMQVLYTAPPPGGRADGAPSSSAASAAGERVLAEAGAMNVFVLFERDAADGGKALHLATPPLDGTILPGVTRDSLLALARAGGGGGGGAALASVAERHVTVAELEAAAAAGQLREIFCCGTAVGVLSVGALVREGAGAGGAAAAAAAGAAAGAQRQPLRPSAAHAPGDDESATLAGRLRARLRDIQTGVVAFNGWAVPVGDGESSG